MRSPAPQPLGNDRPLGLLGLLWGLTGLSNPALLIFLPVCGLWVLAGAPDWKHQARRSRCWQPCCLPPALDPGHGGTGRSSTTSCPARGNFGAELYLGNGPGSTGLLMEYDHPIQAPDQLRLYTRMGEIAYSKMRGDQALAVDARRPRALCPQYTQASVLFLGRGSPSGERYPWVEYARSLNFVFGSVCGLLGLALALVAQGPGCRADSRGPSCCCRWSITEWPPTPAFVTRWSR